MKGKTMQINNNCSSPNFGMALKISKGARKALENASFDEIKTLQKAGEELKDTKFYHVAVDENLKCNLQADKNAYFGWFNTPFFLTHYGATKNSQGLKEIDRNIIHIYGKKPMGVGTDLYGVARYEHEGKPVFNVWDGDYALNDISNLDQLTSVTKILDGVAAEKYAEATSKTSQAARAKKNEAIENLLDSYGE